MYRSDDICIVGAGCVLPEASNPDEFWKNLLAGHCSIAPLPENRWKKSLYVSKDPKEPDTTYSNYAGYIRDAQLEKILDGSDKTRLQLLSLEAARQCFDGLKLPLDNLPIFLGCMGADESLSIAKLLEEEANLKVFVQQQPASKQAELNSLLDKTFDKLKALQKNRNATHLPTSVLQAIKDRWRLAGPGALIDAACASSLTAVDLAIQQLRAGQCRMALTGGIEGQLAPENFIVFSQVGLLAKSVPHPLDESADGMCQGEGVALFALQRLEHALEDQHTILGVIRSCEGSSNGKAASLFSPTVKGQKLAIGRSRRSAATNQFDYFECHGTGTRVGDTTELKTLDQMQAGSSTKVPVGSVKALIGHTKGTAGAAGLLKGLLTITHKTIPPSPYFKNFIEKDSIKHLTVNTQPVSLAQKKEPIVVGVSAAGFGGANYHLVLEEYVSNTKVITALSRGPQSLCLLGKNTVGPENIREKVQAYRFKLPPKNLAQMDVTQLQALIAVADTFEKTRIPLASIEADRVSVIACSTTGLQASYDFSKRIRHKEFIQFSKDKRLAKTLEDHKEVFAPVTEDTGPGTLNNVIAGRVCNIFDFTGKNFNIDADLASFGAAIAAAQNELIQSETEYIVLLKVDETLESSPLKIIRSDVHCYLLTLENIAQRDNRTIIENFSPIEYQEKWHTKAQ